MALTYNGSTAGSTLANPPVLLVAGLAGHVPFATTGGNSGAKLWFYASSNDPLTELLAAGTFNDGVALGMSIGDVLIGVKTSAASTAPVVFMGTLVTSAGSTSFTLSSNIISSTAV